MKISHIVVHDLNRAIGKDNSLPWHIPADLQRFKNLTLDNAVIMGRKTYDSIGKPLVNRLNIVITRQNITIAGVMVYHSVNEALDDLKKMGLHEVFIIGGQQIYEQTMHLIDTAYITVVNTNVEGADAFYPVLDESFILVDECYVLGLDGKFLIYRKRLKWGENENANDSANINMGYTE